MATYHFVRGDSLWVALIIEINHPASVKRIVVLMPESHHLLCSFLQPYQVVSLPLAYPVYALLAWGTEGSCSLASCCQGSPMPAQGAYRLFRKDRLER